MSPKHIAVALVAIAVAITAISLWSQPWANGSSPTADPKPTQAGVDFAARVDQICIATYNQMMADSAVVEARTDWSDARIEAERLGLSGAQGREILSFMANLGDPPERIEEWAKWRGFMARRAALKTRASVAAADKRWVFRAYLMNLTYAMKDRQDVLGRSLGLNACASG